MHVSMTTYCRVVAFRKAHYLNAVGRLAAEAVERAPLVLEHSHHVHGGHRLPLCVLGVGHCVSDDALQEHLEDTSGFLVDETADALHATPTGKTMDGGLGDALEVHEGYLPVTLCTSATHANNKASVPQTSHPQSLTHLTRRVHNPIVMLHRKNE